jgi:hypothetical protein
MVVSQGVAVLCFVYVQALFIFYHNMLSVCASTEWGIKISHVSKGHCAGCSGGREVGLVSCGWLASTFVSSHNGLDR